jgi:SOS-response transcriptional repressor LexA
VKRPAATYFVRVEGDSMEDDGIRHGDLLVVDRSLRPASKDEELIDTGTPSEARG